MRRFACGSAIFAGLLVASTAIVGPGCFTSAGDHQARLRVSNRWLAVSVVSQASHPSALALARDGRIFYTEKNTGQVRVVVDGVLAATPFVTVPVNYAGNRGLLGIALHPDFDENGRVYLFYTRSALSQSTDDPQAVIDQRVVYFVAAGDVAIGGEVFVASLPADLGITNVSGRLAFAADGKLLVAVGDQSTGDPALDPGTLVGKILRFNDDGSIPDDNPSPDSPVYARGFADVRGLAIDPVDGTPVGVEHNAAGRDEIDRIRAGGNYGWPQVLGMASKSAEREYAASNPDYVDPIWDDGSPTGFVGGAFNPSGRYGPNAELQFFFGQAGRNRVMMAKLTAGRGAFEQVEPFADGFPGTITDLAFSPAGTLYVSTRGAIFEIVPRP